MSSLGSLITGQAAGNNQTGVAGANGQSQFNADDAGTTATAGSNQFNNQTGQIQGVQANQNNLANMLMQQAQGNGPNVANTQLQQSLAQNQQQQAGAIGSIKGINPALQARMIQQGGQQAAMGAAGQASVNTQQQMVNAQNQLGSALANQQQGNLGAQNAGTALYGTAAGLNQATAGQNAANATTMRGQNITATQNQLSDLGSIATNVTSGGGVLGSMAGGGIVPDVLHLIGLADGGRVVPGKAPFPGNDPRNDIVTGDMPGGQHIAVSPEEGILPRSVMDDPEAAAAFARDMVKHHLKTNKDSKGYGAVLRAQRGL